MGKLLDSAKSKDTSTGDETSPHNNTLSTPKTNNANLKNKLNTEPLSASLVSSVNIAAETARLVLDQSSQPSHHAHVNPSPLSNAQEQDDSTANSTLNNYNLDWGGDNGFNKTVTFSSPIPHSTSKSTLTGKLDVSVRSELTENSATEETPKGAVPGSSPPPLAFQNLPMGRSIPVSNHSETNSEGLGGGLMGNSTTKPSEITNHFDAAAAISAALASSHLAQASQHGVGELQKSLVASKKKGFSRDESFTDDSLGDMVLTPSSYASQPQNNFLKEKKHASSLPSKEEAVEEMCARRCSYDSYSDESFTDYLSKAYDDKGEPNNNAGGDLFMEFVSNVSDSKREPESQVDKAVEKIDGRTTKLIVDNVTEKKDEQNNELHGDNITEKKLEQITDSNIFELPKVDDEIARRKSNQTEGGDSISICSSNGRSSQFENESNTSSYGSSEYSPITMSFGSSSDDGKHEGQGGNVTGILGNLAPMAVAAHGDASYGTTDEEDNNRNKRGGPKMAVVSGASSLIGHSSKPSKQLAPSRTPLKVENKPSEQTPASSLPIDQQYVSLFESFDRNLAQSLEGVSDGDIMFDLSQKFLSSFAAVLGSISDDKKYDKSKECSNNDVANNDTGLTHYDWWYEDASEMLGYNLGIIADGASEHADVLLKENTEQQHRQQEKTSVGIPIVVIRSMWRSCFFDDTDDNEKIEQTLDFIQDNLVNSLHYLARTKDSSLSCLCFSLPLYKDYASYLLLRRYVDSHTIEETVASWHSKFAAALQYLLLQPNPDNGDCDKVMENMNDNDMLTLRRYAAYSLPRHLSSGMLNAVQKGENSLGATEKLLCNSTFFKARTDLLGNGEKRLQELDESLNAEVDKALIKTIRYARCKTSNYLPATIMHIKDVERNFLQRNDDGDNDIRGSGTIGLLTTWRHQLLLLCSEKTTSTASGTMDYGESNPYHNSEILKVAKTLLSKDDAWTNNTDESASKKSSRSRRNRSEIIDPTILANAINADICRIKADLSIGRSMLSLAKFTQRMSNKGTCCVSWSTLQVEVALCLRDSIEILSSTSKQLQTIMSESFSNLEEEDLDDSIISSCGPGTSCLQKFALTRAEAKPLLTLTGIFLAEAWFLLGRMASSQSMTKTHKNKLLMVACFDRALVILSSPKEVPKNYLMEPLNKQKDFLYCNVNHAMGVCLYEAGIYDRSGRCLKDAISLRRKLLDKLRNQASSESNEKQSDGILATLSSFFFSSPQTVSEEMMSNVMQYSVYQCCSLLPKLISVKSSADDLELCLSLTLEYTALTNHANQSYQTALACFQEALILRSLHVGKNSLDIASLHFNTGVVHDDLEQYQQATNRYHESLRIRLNHLKAAPSGESPELEDSVLLTLKCMAHVYKLQDDLDNAIAFYIKALLLLKSKLSRHIEPADEWQIMGMRNDLAVPAPTLIFDEMRHDNFSAGAWKKHFQMINKKILCHNFSEDSCLHSNTIDSKAMHKWQKELSKMHSMVVALVQKKKHCTPHLPDSTRSHNSSRFTTKISMSPASSVTLESLPKSQLGNIFDTALMSSSFCLGKSQMSSQRFDEAVDNFEIALRTKWALDPAVTSDSDSEASSSRLSSIRSKMGSKLISEEDPEEGQLYYALGLANSMLDDHERAVRCFITALRYLRRTLRMVDSLEVARVLFDTATSYYYLCDFDQAETHWQDCLRILKNHETNHSYAHRRGLVLYCLVLNHYAQKTSYDSSIYSMLNEAQTLLSTSYDKTILAYMEFLTAAFLHKRASKVPIRLRPQIQAKADTLFATSAIGDLSWDEMNETSLSLLEQVKNECYFDSTLDDTANMNDLKNLPVSAHVCLLEGQVLQLLGRAKPALNSYKDALNLYCIACGHENIYSASTMHKMGLLCSQSKENGHKALGFFNGAISTRKLLLGGNDPRLAESLCCSATLLTIQHLYENAMARYHEALRIQMATLGQSSNEVATTLTSMGLCHYNHKAYDLALTCFMGALKVRNHRLSHLQRSIDHVKKNTATDTPSLMNDEYSMSNYDKLDEVYIEETALGDVYFNLGNVHLLLGDHTQSMEYFIKARDLKWRHVGGGSIEKIMKRYLWSDIDEDELLGLAHCLHNIGLLFDMKKEHDRSLPHYEEALTIKNALAGLDSSGGSDFALTDEEDNFILRCLDDNTELPAISKATLSTAMTHIRMASVYAKKKLYNYSLKHYCQALKIQRKVLGRDHFTTSVLLNNMGNVLNRTRSKDQHSKTVEFLYKESIRISTLSLGKSHERVASTLFNLGALCDSKQQFDQAIGYYRSALSVYRDKYSTRLRQRLCGSFMGTLPTISGDSDNSSEVLSTGDQIVARNTSFSTKEIQKQYSLVSEALQKATREDFARNGGGICYGSNEYWLRFEVLLFQFVEMLSAYVVDPTNAVVKTMITQSRQRIESAASHAIITAADAMDYQFQLMLQE